MKKNSCLNVPAPGLCLLHQAADDESILDSSRKCLHCLASLNELDARLDGIGDRLRRSMSDEVSVDSECDRAWAKVRALMSSYEPRISLPFDVTADWDAALTPDAEPSHTLKTPSPTGGGSAGQHTLALKRRHVISEDTDPGDDRSKPLEEADYQIQGLLGVGGMGNVYAARQRSMDRPVAIKVLKSETSRSNSSRQTFVSEAMITGRLDHPNIVPIYEVGKQADDALFYSMKQVQGIEWRKQLPENSDRDNLDILLRASDAIAFAHAHEILHRDLKPANIMLGPFGEVLVMDWGLAIPTKDHPDREVFPAACLGGTPNYMAPEMVSHLDGIDCRSDVYLLGGILFEILTGCAPHHLDASPKDNRKRMVASLEAAGRNEIAATNVTGALMDIARKALATVPEDRYQSVLDFQDAIREYLTQEESIELASRSAERLERAKQSGSYEEFSRVRFGFETALERWPENERASTGLKESRFAYASVAYERGDLDLAAALLDEQDPKHVELGLSISQAIVQRESRQKQLRRLRVASVVATLTVAVVASVAAIWINSERSKALLAQQDEAAQRIVADKERQKAVEASKLALASEAKARQESEDAIRNFKIAERNAYYSDMLLLKQYWKQASLLEFRKILDRYRERNDLKGFEWFYWDRLQDSALMSLSGKFQTKQLDVAFSPVGTLIASASMDKMIRVWETASGEEKFVFKGHTNHVHAVSFNSDGTMLASASKDHTVKVWSLVSGEEINAFSGHAGSVWDVCWVGNGPRIASCSADQSIRVWDAITGEEQFVLSDHQSVVRGISISPDLCRIASTSDDGSVKVWDLNTGEEVFTFPVEVQGRGVSFSPDGTQLAATTNTGLLYVWDTKTGSKTHEFVGQPLVLRTTSFSPDGEILVTAGQQYIVKQWRLPNEIPVNTYIGHTNDIRGSSFSPDGTRLATASTDGTVKVWNTIAEQEFRTVGKQEGSVSILKVTFSSDGTRLASAGWTNGISLWDIASGQKFATLYGHSRPIRYVSFSPDGTLLASASSSVGLSTLQPSSGIGEVKIWDVATQQELLALKGTLSGVFCVEFSPNGSQIATTHASNLVRIWDVSSGDELHTLQGHSETPLQLSFSPDGTRLASGGIDKTAIIWSLRTGERSLSLDGHTGPIHCLAYAPNGKTLATAGEFGGIEIWDGETGQLLRSCDGHSRRITGLSFAADGRRLASTSMDGTIKVWDPETAQVLLTYDLERSLAKSHSVEFSPDGQQLVAGTSQGVINIWDARPWTPQLKAQSQTRSYLDVLCQGMESLEELRIYIRGDPTISDAVREQALKWVELFWKNRKR